jgi:hypothetical protein
MKRILIIFMLSFSLAQIAQAGSLDGLLNKAIDSAATAVNSPEKKDAKETSKEVAMGLLPELSNQFGVSEEQAKGGMGALMQVAKGNLSSQEFTQLSQGVPGMDTLLAAAPAFSSNSKSGAISGALSNLGGVASALGGAGMLTKQFESLGLSTEMIGQFASIAIDYFSGNGLDTSALLQKGLGALLG